MVELRRCALPGVQTTLAHRRAVFNLRATLPAGPALRVQAVHVTQQQTQGGRKPLTAEMERILRRCSEGRLYRDASTYRWHIANDQRPAARDRKLLFQRGYIDPWGTPRIPVLTELGLRTLRALP